MDWSQILGAGGLNEQQGQIDQQLADLLARRKAYQPSQNTTGAGSILGGIGDILWRKKFDTQEAALRGQRQDVSGKLTGARGLLADALTGASQPVQAPPDMIAAPGFDQASQEKAQQQKLQHAQIAAMLSGDPTMAQYAQHAPGMALQQQQLDQGAQKFPLDLAMERRKFEQGGPQEALGGLTPNVFELLTNREKTPKFGSAFPGSVIYDQRTGKPVQGPGGSAAPDIIKQTADGIENGTSPPDMKGLGRLRVPVQAELSARGFNLSQANLDWQATQKHLATLNSSGQERLNQAINFVSDTIPVIRQLYAEWQQLAGASGFKLANKATLAATKQLPGRTGAVAQALETQINDFASELGTVYKGGGTSTDKSLGMAASNLQADWNPETFNKALELAEKNIAIRKNSVTHSSVRGTSATNPYAPAPSPEVAAAAPSGAPAAPAPPPTSARPRRTVNGETREWDGQKWVPVGQ